MSYRTGFALFTKSRRFYLDVFDWHFLAITGHSNIHLPNNIILYNCLHRINHSNLENCQVICWIKSLCIYFTWPTFLFHYNVNCSFFMWFFSLGPMWPSSFDCIFSAICWAMCSRIFQRRDTLILVYVYQKFSKSLSLMSS